MKACNPCWTVCGDPTTEQLNACARMALPTGSSRPSKSATGGGNGPRRPVRLLIVRCWCELNSQRVAVLLPTYFEIEAGAVRKLLAFGDRFLQEPGNIGFPDQMLRHRAFSAGYSRLGKSGRIPIK